MWEICVRGYRPLAGEIRIQGSKNGALPMLAASLLQPGTIRFTNVPIIQDITCMVGILESAGCRCRIEDHMVEVDASGILHPEIPREDVAKMRSSILVMGALLGRLGRAEAWYPGGCSIGSRPIDLHLMAFSRLGARVEEENGRIQAFAPHGLRGGEIVFPFPSVGATENALLAAAGARGETWIKGAAREPEIVSLCRLLRRMGADIQGEGSSCIRIRGGKSLCPVQSPIPGDRIVAGTYLAAVACAGGQAVVSGAPWQEMAAVIDAFRRCGAGIEPAYGEDEQIIGIKIQMEDRPRAMDLSTGPYPAFPTDLQSPMLAVLARAKGTSHLRETVFEARFKTAEELNKMGACIRVEGNQAVINGISRLQGTAVQAWDLRGGAAMAAAALGAEGVTLIKNCSHIQRGYEDICRDLSQLGGKISWEPA
ncbi:MAG TPA: UDP-N-acetylglucosamine 1-carboxyvinyltransferase [Candidatus Cottocaccamicrobium excrementipullorum]|nr:UDP-N-acetylglucosamine 1-carboxyvinyltransferase [Candidatus Cottocaccamicrobium excrementipullorum]